MVPSEPIAATQHPSGFRRMPLPLMLVLTVLTAGFYYPFWFLQQRRRINRLGASPEIPRWPFALLALCLLARELLFFWPSGTALRAGAGQFSAAGIATLALAAAWLVTAWQSLAIKRTLERYLMGASAGEQTPNVLSVPQTVLFGAFYLQYAINTAILVEHSSEILERIEAAERLHFTALLVATTPRVVVTPTLVFLNVAMFVAVAISAKSLNPTASAMMRWGADYGPLTTHGQWWRPLAAAFLHFSVLHLLTNVIVLWQVGGLTERLYGHLEFALVYLLAALGGSLVSLWAHPLSVSAGASGAVFGLYGALGAFLLTQRESMPVRLVTTLANSAALFVGMNLATGLLWNARLDLTSPAIHQSTIDMAAHLGGLVTGFVAGCALARKLTPSRSTHVGRSAVVSVAGIVLAVAAARSVPVLDDLPAALDRISELDSRSRAVYNKSVAQLQKHEISTPQFADVLEKQLLPPWNEARRSLLTLRLHDAQRGFALTASAAMGWTAEEWRQAAEGMRSGNVALVERAGRKREAADQVWKTLRARIAHAERPRSPTAPILVGTISSRRREPLADAAVRLTCAPQASPGAVSDAYWQICKAPPVARSDPRGRFEFDRLPAGPYIATVSAPGYKEDERDFEMDEPAVLTFSLDPLVDETAAAVARVAAAEKGADAIFNAGVAKLRSHAISSAQFADIVEKQVLPPWEAARATLPAVDPSDRRAAIVSMLPEYMTLTGDAWRLIAQSVRTNDPGLMKQAGEKRAAARALFKNRVPAQPASPHP